MTIVFGGLLMRIQDTKFLILDTETTGLDPQTDKVVDISIIEVSRRGIIPLFSTLINPERDIPPTASAVHHITQRDVVNQPTLKEVWEEIMNYLRGGVIVAHNVSFDRSMLPETGRPWICSLRLARHLWPDAPAHSNQVLRYWLGIDIDPGQIHSSVADTLVTAEVFKRELSYYRTLYNDVNVEHLIDFVNSPIEIHIMPFGKHKGIQISNIPTDYMEWLLQQNDIDPDLRWTLSQKVMNE